MLSIDELKNKLSDELTGHYEKIFSLSRINGIFLAFKSKRVSTFRINTLKADRHEIIGFLKKNNIKFREINFIQNAFYLDSGEKELSASAIYKSGSVYMQGISSMLPSLILNPQKGEKILDISAAPGSKTTQLAALMNNTGTIDAVEPDHIRMERLKYNADLLGVKIINFHKTGGEKFYAGREGFYDRSLADVPCSGEGIISVFDKKTMRSYGINNMIKYSNLQFKLLKSALLSVKPGGTAVYSTCTLNCIENESVIDRMLKDKDVKIDIMNIDLKNFNAEEMTSPVLKYQDVSFDARIKNAVRFMPSKRFEGFFICRIRRIK